MEEIVGKEKGVEYEIKEGEIKEEQKAMLVFPQLKFLRLGNLPNLTSFYPKVKNTSASEENLSIPIQPLFNEKVAFPALEELRIGHLKNLRKIWLDDQLPVELFCQLKVLEVKGCDKLLNVVPSNMLPRLKNLEELSIEQCDASVSELELFVVEEGHSAVALSRVRKLTLKELPLPQHFFDDKVVFPSLEELELSYGGNVKEIWHGRLPSDSFSKLIFLKVDNYNELLNVFPSNLLLGLQKILVLTVEWCASLEEVFNLEELNVEERQAVAFSQLWKLTLKFLPRLVHIWTEGPHEVSGFRNLTNMTVHSCNNLRNLFSPSVARCLVKLQVLEIKWCNMMEEIVTSREQGEASTTQEIEFPRLRSLVLANLPNLTSFCWANYDFKLPSLKTAKLERCPKMRTFTSGVVSTPKIEKTSASDDQWLWMGDLNDYVQQKVFKGKGLAMDDDDSDEEQERMMIPSSGFSHKMWRKAPFMAVMEM